MLFVDMCTATGLQCSKKFQMNCVAKDHPDFQKEKISICLWVKQTILDDIWFKEYACVTYFTR